jgi:osmoprotectant transport system permease protein
MLAGGAKSEVLTVGSKRFTESYLLGEIVRATAAPHATVTHRQGLGNTAIVYAALKAGAIDLYPDYTGTLIREVLKRDDAPNLAELDAALARDGLGVAVPLGFHNGYAIALRADLAREMRIATLSDLRAHPTLKLGLSHEFLARADGWPGLAKRYGLTQRPSGIDHGIAYAALANQSLDGTDIYTTDAKIARERLAVLADDLKHFPRYDAVLVHRRDLAERAPAAWRAIRGLEGRIDEARMIAMNGQAELDGKSFTAVAQEFVSGGGARRASFAERLIGQDFWRLLAQHAGLTLAAVAAAIAIGVPLGIAAARRPALTGPLLAATGMLQTVPSLALLALLIPLLGSIGTGPALIALTLYALLPVVQNTVAALSEVPAGLKAAGTALGLAARDILRHVELPLALPVILAGVETAAVTTVGTATIAAFIGAGGFGERIAAGLATNDHALLVAGALPAAALALATQGLFVLLRRRFARR